MDARRTFVRTRILKAAQDRIFADGLALTVQEIADAAGVSRPTVFRHFGTLDALLAEAVTEGFQEYVELLPKRGDSEVFDWLYELLLAAHRENYKGGHGYCELVMRDDLSGPLAEVLQPRRRRYLRFTYRVAAECWREMGGTGDAPKWVTDAFGAHLSSFFAFSLKYDVGLSPEQTAELAIKTLRAILDCAVEEQSPGETGSGSPGRSSAK